MERYLLIDTLKRNPHELKNFPDVARDDEELVRIAVKKDGSVLQYASARLRGDFETVMIAVKKTGTSLNFASDALKNNAEIIAAAVQADGAALEFVPKKFQNDRQLILEASRNCNVGLIPERFLSDKEVAERLIANDCQAFAYLSSELRRDIDLIAQATKTDSSLFMYLPEGFLEDKTTVMELLNNELCVVPYISDEIKIDKDIALAAMHVPGSPYAYDALPLELAGDTDILREFVYNVTPGEEADFCRFFNSASVPAELLADDDFVYCVADLYEYAEDVPELDKAFALRMIELQVCDTDFLDELMDDPDIQAALAENYEEDF